MSFHDETRVGLPAITSKGRSDALREAAVTGQASGLAAEKDRPKMGCCSGRCYRPSDPAMVVCREPGIAGFLAVRRILSVDRLKRTQRTRAERMAEIVW